MIKQDNRPKKNISENRLDALKNLLQEDISGKKAPADTQEDQKKIVIISVNGNNNIVSAEKSRQINWRGDKKICFAAGIVLCMLFF